MLLRNQLLGMPICGRLFPYPGISWLWIERGTVAVFENRMSECKEICTTHHGSGCETLKGISSEGISSDSISALVLHPSGLVASSLDSQRFPLVGLDVLMPMSITITIAIAIAVGDLDVAEGLQTHRVIFGTLAHLSVEKACSLII